jgi:hypothetical protein
MCHRNIGLVLYEREASTIEIPLVHQNKFAAIIRVFRWEAECRECKKGPSVMNNEKPQKNIGSKKPSGAQAKGGN